MQTSVQGKLDLHVSGCSRSSPDLGHRETPAGIYDGFQIELFCSGK